MADRRVLSRAGILWVALILLLVAGQASAQCSFGAANCTSSMPNGTSVNFDALTWTFVSGSACPTGGSTSYNGNLQVTMANNTFLTISSDFTVNGDFNITNSGSNATLTIPVGVTLHVTGDFGDCTNNNVNFVVNGSLIVDGYVSGKNGNAFAGTGTVTATGGLFFNTAPTCTSCTIVWDVGSCAPVPSTFCTLPIHLLFFKAAVTANGVHLRWATSSEENFDFFTLEKSSNGKDFYGIADLPGHGNSTVRNDYSFRDEHTLIGKTYYRLRETDLDGKVIYHRIISVEYAGGRLLDLYPVPVTQGVLNLRTNFPTNQDARVTITDMTGLVLQEGVLRAEAMSIPLKLEPGIYLLTFISGDYRTVKRFIVH